MIKKVKKLHNPFIDEAPTESGQYMHPLEWDEAVADTGSPVEDQIDQHAFPLPSKAIIFLVAAGLSILSVRLLYLQVAQGRDFAVKAEGNRTRKLALRAPRGYILDRNGERLVQNGATFSLVAIPFDLPREGLDQTIQKLGEVLHVSTDEIHAAIADSNRSSFEPIIIKSNVTPEDRILFETKASEFPGFSILTLPVREYVAPEVYAHVLGYTSTISQKEIDEAPKDTYEPIDVVGKSGIEQSYEKFLKGKNGRQEVEVDASGKMVKVLGSVEPETGDTLTLNIDKGLQDELYKYFSIGGQATAKGAAVAMNPKTGEVLALVSLPGFDTNLFSHGIDNDTYQKLLNDKNLPLFNRAVAGVYPPGSTVKPMVAAAALQEGVVTPNTIINDTGKLVIPNQYNPSISYNFLGWKLSGLGPMTVRSAIAKSSDIYFYVVAGGHPSSHVDPLGIRKLSDWYRKFNLGKVTGIDISGEKTGVVADPDWKANYFKDDAILSKWYLGDTYHVGIGQGDMLVTPLQVAEWTATIANYGVGMKPTLLKNVTDGDGKVVYEPAPQVLISKVANDDVIQVVREGMRETIESGSGVQLHDLSITSGGKTGTSQFDGSDPKRTHAWFTAFAPYDDPQIVVTVLVEAGGEGHVAAVPIVKNVLKWWSENRYNK